MNQTLAILKFFKEAGYSGLYLKASVTQHNGKEPPKTFSIKSEELVGSLEHRLSHSYFFEFQANSHPATCVQVSMI